MNLNLPSYTIIEENDLFVLIVDLDDGQSVTTGAEKVVKDVDASLLKGLGKRRLYYRDTTQAGLMN